MGKEDKKANKEKLEKMSKELPKSARDFEYEVPAEMTIEDREKELVDLIGSLEIFLSTRRESLPGKVINEIEELVADLKKIKL